MRGSERLGQAQDVVRRRNAGCYSTSLSRVEIQIEHLKGLALLVHTALFRKAETSSSVWRKIRFYGQTEERNGGKIIQ